MTHIRSRALLVLALALCAAATALAQTAPRTAPETPAASAPASPTAVPLSAATTTMLQQRAQDFLRLLYAWGSDFEVKAGAVKPTPIPDLYEINVQVTLQGDSESALVYVTKDGHYMVRGEVSDMNADPFAAVREKLIVDGAPSKGPADASIVMVEFGDFQCPSCRQLDLILRDLLPKYPQVRLVFKDFPLEQLHPWAMTAAMVGRCAFQQSSDAFWKVHDLIYDNQDHITPDNAYDRLIQLGSDAGLDAASLRTCVSDPQTTQTVRKSMAEGTALQIDSTPTTFVNGRTVVGPNEALIRQYLSFILQK